MRNNFATRFISMLLIVALLVGFILPASVAATNGVSYNLTSNSAVSNPLRPQQTEDNEYALYAPDEIVRVSIVLWRAPTIQAGFAAHGIAKNEEAMAYRAQLKNNQNAITAEIEHVLGQELDVVWNLTLAANLISANVQYGQIQAIASIPGVKQVVLETRYDTMDTVANSTDKPQMTVATGMTGASQVWETGYTGGGTRIAIIDTGLDTDHQSFDPDAFVYALQENAAMAGLSYEEYVASLNLLDVEELAEKLPELNVVERNPGMTAEELYVNMKAPFGYNYLDDDLDITHDNDSQGSHGSHVSGISAANRYIKRGDEYVSAAETVSMQGAAPDAQIIVMKVFGKMGGTYESDYFAAVEDAIILDCDAINLSLGSSSAGFTVPNSEYRELLKYLVETESVVAMAAGNQAYWPAYSSGLLPNLYVEDVNFQTAGTPGTYPNALTVASVENDGAVMPSLEVAGNNFSFMDGDGYWNEPMVSMDPSGEGTEYEYVFIDGIGVESDYEGIDVAGKMVFVARGETNFADKANIAVAHGAIATIIYNNVAEGLTMNLTGYQQSAPCVFISQANGQMVRVNSQAATTENGVTYYTGTITVNSTPSPAYENSSYYTMSIYSSWGVPGDLSMKPEITAPGGNIYSVNGNVPETDQYELSSGTSMATPHISALAALMKQAIRERGLSQDGMTDRALVQSILMSTALPLKDAEGRYYAILQQGAGLANILAAVSADSYVMVEGQDDGKVKAELGDDPDRTGEYTFSFTINNLMDVEKAYALYADMFTQDVFYYYANTAAAEAGDDSNLALYLDTATVAMDFTATWTSNGQLVDNTVTVPANGSVEVTVTLALTEEQKEVLDAYYVNGAYVQAFVYADGVADAEGVEGTCHSIPVLGFYGNWSDPSMYEVGTVQTHATGEENHDPYTGTTAVNSLSVEYARDPGYTYYLGGNPVVPDSVYHPERNAFNNKNGDKIDDLQINTLRNAYTSRLTATNLATGEVLKQYESGRIFAPYYGVIWFMEMWLEGIYSYRLQWAPKTVEEGDTVEFRVDTALEYYVDENGNVDWDAMGAGATLTIPLTMDSTAPTILDIDVDVENNVLTVEASDNQYVAGVALFNGSGKEVLTYVGSKEDAVPGETYTYELDLRVANGTKFLIQVYDYAYNVTTYELRMELGVVPPLPDLIAFDKQYDYYWTAFTVDSWYRDLLIYSETGDVVFNAATIYDHYVFACTNTGDLYVMPERDLSDMMRIRNIGVVFEDMAVNPVDGEIYGIAYNENNESVLYTVDKMVGTITEVGTVGLNTNTLAIDPDGTFYCNEFGTSMVYSFTLETMHQPTYMLEVVNEYGDTFETMGTQAMEYNPNNGNVVWISYYYEEKSWGNWDYSYLYEIHPETNTYTLHNDMSHQLVALIIPEEGNAGSWADPTDEVMSLEMTEQDINMLRGSTVRLTFTILPWNLSDRSVTWSSSDPSVAEVNQYGLVTALKTGTTTITVTSNLNPNLQASTNITVEALPIYMEGVLLNEEGTPMLFNWDMASNATWTPGMPLDTVLLGAVRTPNGDLLGMDASARTVVRVDMSTGTSTELGTWETQIYDMAYSNLFSDEETDRVHMISGSFWIPAKDPANPLDDQAWDLFDYIFDQSYAFEFIAIATGDIVTVEDAGNTYEAEELFLLDDNGHVWKLNAYFDGEFYNSTDPVCYTSNLEQAGYELNRLEESMLPLCSMVVGEDGNLYFSGYNGKTSVFYQLVLNEETLTAEAIAFADSGEDVWPAMLLDVKNESLEMECWHTNTEIRNALEVTCTEPGYTGDTYCVDCGQLLAEGEAVEATGHNSVVTDAKEATCTEDGYTGDTYCADCGELLAEGEVVEAKGHSYAVTDTKEASCTEDGYTTYTCHCGDTHTEVTLATGHSYVDGTCEHCGEEDADNPPTGSANLYAIALVAMMSLGAVAVCAGKKRHN